LLRKKIRQVKKGAKAPLPNGYGGRNGRKTAGTRRDGATTTNVKPDDNPTTVDHTGYESHRRRRRYRRRRRERTGGGGGNVNREDGMPAPATRQSATAIAAQSATATAAPNAGLATKE